MPRRLITSEIFSNEKVGELTLLGRLLFIGIITNADDDGRLKASSKFLKARIFPYNNDITPDNILEQRDRCHNLGLIYLYNMNGSEYLSLPTWLDHQQIRKDRYKASTLPPPDNQAATECQPSDNYWLTQYNIIQYNLSKYNIFLVWNSKKIIVHQKLTDAIKATIQKVLKNYSEETVCQAIKNYAEILKDEQYYFKYSWTLKDFLNRGLEKFIDGDVARKNFLKDGKDGADRQGASKVRTHPDQYTDPADLLT